MSGRVILNRKLLLEAPVDIPDGAGGYQRSWNVLGTHWGEIRSGYGRDSKSGELPVSRLNHRIVLRAVPLGATSRPHPEQRFREGSRIFLIAAVADFGTDGRYLVCQVKEETVQ